MYVPVHAPMLKGLLAEQMNTLMLLAQEDVPPATTSIWERLFELPPPFNMVVLIVAIIFLGSAISAIAGQVRVFADHEADRRLKRDMIEAGYTPEDAQQLVDLEVTKDYVPQEKSSA